MWYSIEVNMTPAEHDSPKAPYFWMIRVHYNSCVGNGGHGWAATPEEAWKEALEYYNKVYKEN